MKKGLPENWPPSTRIVNFGFWPRAAPGAGRVTFVAWREIICEYLPENYARDGFGSRPGPKPKIDHPGRGGQFSGSPFFQKAMRPSTSESRPTGGELGAGIQRESKTGNQKLESNRNLKQESSRVRRQAMLRKCAKFHVTGNCILMLTLLGIM